MEPLRRNPESATAGEQAASGHQAYVYLLLVAVAVVALDQLTKALVAANLSGGRTVGLLGGAARLVYARNSGAAFGIFPDRGTLFAAVAVIVAVGILLSYRRLARSPLVVRLASGLLLGGAVGNLIDRVRLGYVVDFIDVGWWPVFNLADSSIVLGVVTLFVYAALSQERST